MSGSLESWLNPDFLIGTGERLIHVCGGRNMEDFVTWVDSSKIKRTVLKYRDEVDDYDLL